MRYLTRFVFLWALVLICLDYQARGYGFSALGCIALAAYIIPKFKS